MVGLHSLVGRKLLAAKVYNTAMDLVLKFEDGLTLLIFSVAVDSDPESQNYSIYTPQQVLTVGFDATVSAFQRDL